MEILIYLFFGVVSYLLGSFPTAFFIVKKFTGKDIRKEETGNVGAMNTMRITGKKNLFIAVFLIDAFKGFLALLIPWLLQSKFPYDITTAYTISSFGVVLGHCYSIYFKVIDGKFAGGKAVSTMAGILLFLSFGKLFLTMGLFMLLIAAVTRNFFASQFFAALVLPLITVFLEPKYLLLVILCVIPILIKQSPRVIPFLKGKEPKLYWKRKK